MTLRNYIEERILEAARKLFDQNGFAETDMKAIAKEAEIAVGTIYNYYQSKNALYERIMVDNWEKTIENLQIISQAHKDPHIKVNKLIMCIYECVEVQKSLMIEVHNADTPRPGKFKEMFEKLKVVKEIFAEALSDKQDARRLADTIIAVIPRLVHSNSGEKQQNLDFLYRLKDNM